MSHLLTNFRIRALDLHWVSAAIGPDNERPIRVAERLGMLDRVVINVAEYGNTSTASIPLALQEAVDDGRVKDGDQLLFVAFGGGLSWAASCLKWYGGGAAGVSAAEREGMVDA